MEFAKIIWQNEPVSSGQLVKLANDKLQWKKSTTYTVIKKLCEKGIAQNQEGTVTTLISLDEYYTNQSEQFLEETFSGSLPQFLTAFSRSERMSEREIEEIQKLIDQYKEVQSC